MKCKFILTISCVMLFIQVTSAGISEDYINEFNLEGETCQIIDAFIYDISDPWIFYKSHKFRTLPVIYQCCLENGDCTSIVFDVENKIFLNENYVSEIVDINYIRYNLHNGNLSLNYFQTEGLDFCDYFGMKDVKTQSINFASETVEVGATVLKTEKTYQAVKTIDTARRVGVIGSFNPSKFIAGVACGYDDEKLREVLEILAQSNFYLSNINYGYSQEGYVKYLASSMATSKYYLDEYLKSPTAMARGGVNYIINLIKSIFDVSTQKNKIFKQDKTEYQIAQEVSKKLQGSELFIKNPNNSKIIGKNLERLNFNVFRVEQTYDIFINNYNRNKLLLPSSISVFFKNIFFEPNYDITLARECFNDAKKYKKLTEDFYEQNKFNSAIESISNGNSSLECAEPLLEREKNIFRSFDFRVLLFFLVIVVGVILLIRYREQVGEVVG